MDLKVLDLFAGIGGFSLGLERAGFSTVAFCENNKFCQQVLAKHWPDVPIYDDVRQLTNDRLHADGIHVDVITGGFPCQDISVAGKNQGIKGERSGLWSEFARLIGEIRPRWAIVENVAVLRSRGLDVVLGDLATLGYDARWDCIPAAAVGAPHRRDRVWVVAYPGGSQLRHQSRGRNGAHGADTAQPADHGKTEPVAHSDSKRREQHGEPHGHTPQSEQQTPRWHNSGRCGADVADYCQANVQWLVEPDVGRLADGVPNRVDRLRSLGNSLVPQIPEKLGRIILEIERELWT